MSPSGRVRPPSPALSAPERREKGVLRKTLYDDGQMIVLTLLPGAPSFLPFHSSLEISFGRYFSQSGSGGFSTPVKGRGLSTPESTSVRVFWTPSPVEIVSLSSCVE